MPELRPILLSRTRRPKSMRVFYYFTLLLFHSRGTNPPFWPKRKNSGRACKPDAPAPTATRKLLILFNRTSSVMSVYRPYRYLSRYSGRGCEASAIESAVLRMRLLTVPGPVSFQSVGRSWPMFLQP
jgi:hypothetical protein